MENYRLKDFFKSPIFAIRRKPLYYKYWDFVRNAFKWQPEQINEWQWAQVKKIVEYAYFHVPYYHEIYQNVGFEPGDLKSWSDFEGLPSVSKSDIKENLENFYSDERRKISYRDDYTGGSTGQAMHFLIDDDLYYREDAVYRYYWASTGFDIGDKCVILRGHRLIKDDRKFNYKYNPSWKYLILDSSYISAQFLPEYDRVIKRFNIKNIQCFPSSLSLLARTYQNSNLEPPRFDRVYFGSENVYNNQIEVISSVFKPKLIINQYGHTERVLLALQNVEEGGLGFVPFYGYMELLNDKSDAINKNGEVGEITGTGFSKSMPFIRYKTNDFASYSTNHFIKSMRGWKKIDKIEGRLQEFVVTNDRRLVSIASISGQVHITEMSKIWDMQYEQEKVGELFINAVNYKNKDLSPNEIEMIESKVQDVLGNKMNCKVRIVNKIERTNRNKKMMLIQKLNIRDYM